MPHYSTRIGIPIIGQITTINTNNTRSSAILAGEAELCILAQIRALASNLSRQVDIEFFERYDTGVGLNLVVAGKSRVDDAAYEFKRFFAIAVMVLADFVQ